jgi:hypothetical protein
LPIGHLEQIDLRHGSGDVEQPVDPTKRAESLLDHRPRRRGQTEIDIDDQRFCAGNLHRSRGLVEMGAVSRDKNQRGKITRLADRGGPADALTRTVTIATGFAIRMLPVPKLGRP